MIVMRRPGGILHMCHTAHPHGCCSWTLGYKSHILWKDTGILSEGLFFLGRGTEVLWCSGKPVMIFPFFQNANGVLRTGSGKTYTICGVTQASKEWSECFTDEQMMLMSWSSCHCVESKISWNWDSGPVIKGSWIMTTTKCPSTPWNTHLGFLISPVSSKLTPSPRGDLLLVEGEFVLVPHLYRLLDT